MVLVLHALVIFCLLVGVLSPCRAAERSLLQQVNDINQVEQQQGNQLHFKDQSDMDQVKDYISPKEYLVALYVIPLWLCLILICLRGTSRWSSSRRGQRRRPGGASGSDGRNDANTNTDNNNNNNSGGLNSRTLQKLRQFRYSVTASKKKCSKYHTTECSVCMDAFQEGDLMRQLPGCGHIFHSECVDEWLKHHPSCPICRKDTRQALEEVDGVDVDNNDDGTSRAAPADPPTNETAEENHNDYENVAEEAPASSSAALRDDPPPPQQQQQQQQQDRIVFSFGGVSVNPLHVEAGRDTRRTALETSTSSTSTSSSSYVPSWVSGPMDAMARNWNAFRYAARSSSHRSRAREAAVQAALE
jgi:hypothetical protein